MKHQNALPLSYLPWFRACSNAAVAAKGSFGKGHRAAHDGYFNISTNLKITRWSTANGILCLHFNTFPQNTWGCQCFSYSAWLHQASCSVTVCHMPGLRRNRLYLTTAKPTSQESHFWQKLDFGQGTTTSNPFRISSPRTWLWPQSSQVVKLGQQQLSGKNIQNGALIQNGGFTSYSTSKMGMREPSVLPAWWKDDGCGAIHLTTTSVGYDAAKICGMTTLSTSHPFLPHLNCRPSSRGEPQPHWPCNTNCSVLVPNCEDSHRLNIQYGPVLK